MAYYQRTGRGRVVQPLTYSPVSAQTKSEEYRQSRLDMQLMYNEDKIHFLEKEREKARKKLMEKLERYKGVGLLGNRLGSLPQEDESNSELKRRLDELTKEIDDIRAQLGRQNIDEVDNNAPISEEKLKMKVVATREEQQKRLKEEAERHLPIAQIEEQKRKEKEKERALRKLEKYKGVGLLGQRLGSEDDYVNDCQKTEAAPIQPKLKMSVIASRKDQQKCLKEEAERLPLAQIEEQKIKELPTYGQQDGMRNRFSEPTKSVVSVNNQSERAISQTNSNGEEIMTEEAKTDDNKTSFDNELAEIRRKQQEMYLARLKASKKDD